MKFKKVVGSIGLDFSFNILQTFLSFIAIPIYIGLLGGSSYGVWLGIVGYIGLVAIFDLPFDNKLILLTSSLDTNSRDYFESLITVMVLKALNICILLIAYIGFRSYIPEVINAGEIDTHVIQMIVDISIANLLIGMLFSSFSAILFGKSDFNYLVMVQGVAGIISVLASLALLWIGLGIYSLVIGQSISIAISAILNLLRFREKHIIRINYDLLPVNKNKIKEIFYFAINFQYLKLGSALRNGIPHVVINKFLGPEFNTIYMAISKIPVLMLGYVQRGAQFALPFMMKNKVQATEEKLHDMFVHLFCFSFCIFMFIIQVNQNFTQIWLKLDTSAYFLETIIICFYGFIMSVVSILQQRVIIIKEDFYGQNIIQLIEFLIILTLLSVGIISKFNEIVTIIFLTPVLGMVYILLKSNSLFHIFKYKTLKTLAPIIFIQLILTLTSHIFIKKISSVELYEIYISIFSLFITLIATVFILRKISYVQD